MDNMFRPCIDLHDGRVKQIVGGTISGGGDAQTNFVSGQPPEYYAELYRDDRLQGGHVIMLGPGNEAAATRALNAWPGGLQLGGGVNPDNAAKWLDAGASAVIVTSYVFSGGELKLDRLKEMYDLVGRDRLVLDLSCRVRDGEYYIVTDLWRKFTNRKVDADTLEFLAGYCSEFLIHAVDVEGRQAGIDGTLLELLADKSPIGCVYAGGVASFEDVDRIVSVGRGKVHYTIGSALDIFGGKLSYREVVARDKKN